LFESNRALDLAPWGRCRGTHGALSSKESFKRTFAHDRKDHQEGRHRRRISIIGKDTALASSRCLVISFEDNYNIIN
jgi:hypothetical protein